MVPPPNAGGFLDPQGKSVPLPRPMSRRNPREAGLRADPTADPSTKELLQFNDFRSIESDRVRFYSERAIRNFDGIVEEAFPPEL